MCLCFWQVTLKFCSKRASLASRVLPKHPRALATVLTDLYIFSITVLLKYFQHILRMVNHTKLQQISMSILIRPSTQA